LLDAHVPNEQARHGDWDERIGYVEGPVRHRALGGTTMALELLTLEDERRRP
jgi:hypothetical protein